MPLIFALCPSSFSFCLPKDETRVAVSYYNIDMPPRMPVETAASAYPTAVNRLGRSRLT